MLKIHQARLQQFMNRELPDVQTGYRKGRGTWDQIADIHCIMEKARGFQKKIYFCFIDYINVFDYVDHNKLWKILKEVGIPDHLITGFLRNLYTGKEATVKTRYGTMKWFKFGKGGCQGCILSPCLFNLYAGYIMWNPRLDESQAEIKILGEISITLDMQVITHSNSRKWRGTKEPPDEGEGGKWKRWFKTHHSKN